MAFRARAVAISATGRISGGLSESCTCMHSLGGLRALLPQADSWEMKRRDGEEEDRRLNVAQRRWSRPYNTQTHTQARRLARLTAHSLQGYPHLLTTCIPMHVFWKHCRTPQVPAPRTPRRTGRKPEQLAPLPDRSLGPGRPRTRKESRPSRRAPRPSCLLDVGLWARGLHVSRVGV